MLHLYKKIRVGVAVVSVLSFCLSVSGADQQFCSNSVGTLNNGTAYSVWLSNATTGTNCGTFYNNDAAFKAKWNMNNGGDFLARAGLQWDETKTYDQLGTISADYAYTKTGVSSTTAYIGIYGWSNNPLVEFYIVEEWIGWNPASNAAKKGTITVDGDTYDIYTHTQSDQPSIHGTATFLQVFSIRKTARQSGHISISEHFKQWEKAGVSLGKMYEAKILVEAMGGTGTIDFSKGTVVATTTSVAHMPKRGSSMVNCSGNGVLSLVTLNGTVIRSVRQTGSEKAIIPIDNVSPGVYFLQFQGEGKAPVTKTFLVK